MNTDGNTRAITDLLKSIAILVVMLGHYAQYLASDYYTSWFRGYAFGVVAIFFVLAGYGADFSLQKRRAEGSVAKVLPGYYLSRALRIYPAYWVALVLTASYFREYDVVYQLDPYTVAVFLAIPFVNAPGVFWFVPAIVLCYILAPFIHALLTQSGTGRYLAILLGSVPVSLAVTLVYFSTSLPESEIFSWSNLNILFYKHYFLSYVLLFSLGMSVSAIISRHCTRAWRGGYILPAAVLFAATLYLTRDSYTFYSQDADLFLTLAAPLFVAGCFTLCLVTIASGIRVPAGRLAGYPGRYSYQLYLFHMLYIALLARFGLIRDNDIRSLLLFLLLLPLLIMVFRGIDYAWQKL